MNVSSQELSLLLAAVGGIGVVVSIVAQLLKRAFGTKSKVIVHAIVIGLTVIAAAAQYVVTLGSDHLPKVVLGVSGAAIYGFSQLVYNGSKFLASNGIAVESQLDQSTTVVAPVEPSKLEPARRVIPVPVAEPDMNVETIQGDQ